MATHETGTVEIAEEAYSEIVAETERSPDTETGGVLVGLLDQGIILDASGPGPGASKRATHFKTDALFCEEFLKSSRRRFRDSTTVLGYWHKHPSGLECPSGGDLVQALELAREFESAGDHGVVVVIITTQRPSLKAFLLGPSSSSFCEAGVVRVDRERVKAALEECQCHPVAGVPAQDREWQGRARLTRLRHEVKELAEAGLHGDIKQVNRREFLVLKVALRTLVFIPPREFPQNPPRVFWRESGQEVQRSQVLGQWSSDRSILEVAREIQEKLERRYYRRLWSIPNRWWR